MAEPLAVCLHAAKPAGSLLGKQVLITGAGPIGALCVLVARFAGAACIVVTDVADEPLVIATKIGADEVINVVKNSRTLQVYGKEKRTLDVLFEASGNQAALASALDVLRPGAVSSTAR